MTDTATIEPGPEPAPEAEVPEGLELHGNGTVTVHLDDRRIRLRRPKAGEYRAFREAWERYTDLVTEASEDAAEQMEPIRTAANEGDGRRLTPDERALDRRLSRDLIALGERLRASWLLLVLSGDDPADLLAEPIKEGLASRSLPDDEGDWPVWLTASATATTLFKHWQTVPSPRGVR